MSGKPFLTICIWLLLISSFPPGAEAQTAPKRELRAAWIATIANIDWPSKPGLSVDSQKAEYIRLLDMLKNLGMNAVVVQIRPAADAFYQSDIEPWSYWLTGVQGLAPAPYYDPLKFMIEEAHEHGMEFHAWFNPYRAVPDIYHAHLAPDNITVQHPEWFITYGKTKIFNPGLPQVWDYLNKVIDDVVKRYDIDAIQFDDYFYPYRIAGKEFNDYGTYLKYGNGMSIGDWRRHNVDTVIEMLSKSIKKIKPWVKFGISPFGVWRNRSQNVNGSMTQAGQTDYDDLYADVLLWLKKGWIDYVCPQIYWSFDNRLAPYGILLDWWAHHTYGRELVIGQAAYRIGSAGFYDPREMVNQIKANRTYRDVGGSIFFSARSFKTNPLGFDDSLRNDLYKYPAIPPAMPWIDSIPPLSPHLASAEPLPDGLLLQWTEKDTAAVQFVVYRFSDSTRLNFHDPSHILAIVNAAFPDGSPKSIQSFVDKKYVSGAHYTYAVTALDRLHNESSPSNLMRIPFQMGFHPESLYDSALPQLEPLPLLHPANTNSLTEGN